MVSVPYLGPGFGGGKTTPKRGTPGRKRHLLVDSLGLVLGVLVTEAQASERKIAAASLMELDEEVSQVEVIWVDAGYSPPNC